MANLDLLRGKVQGILTENFSNIVIDNRGNWSRQEGSARAFVRVWESREGDRSFITIEVPLLLHTPASPELFEHIALHSDDMIFGHLSALRDDDGNVLVMLTHTLLGDYLDEPELRDAFGALLGSGDHLDDELQAQFGGQRFHED